MSQTAFFTTFFAMHPGYHASPDLRFRLRLLKFTILFTKRSVPQEVPLPESFLRKLQHRYQAVSSDPGNSELTAFEISDLTNDLISLNNVEAEKEQISHESNPGNRGSKKRDLCQPVISLLDTIPLFMAVSAAQIAMQEGTITDTWMRLAAGYMAQAAAEQYLVYGSQSQETLHEAFSWGFDPECSAEEGTDEFQINAMFWGVDAVVDGWERIRDEHAQAVRINPSLPCARAHGRGATAHSAGRSCLAGTRPDIDGRGTSCCRI